MQGRTGAVRLSLATGVPIMPAGELGVAGRLAEVGHGEPEVRPAGVAAARASRSICRPAGDGRRSRGAPRDDRRAHGRADGDGRGPSRAVPARWATPGRLACDGRRDRGFSTRAVHGARAARGAGDPQRADLPDVDVPVRHVRGLRRDDRVPQGRLHLHARVRQPHGRGVRIADGRARGHRGCVRVRVGHGRDPHRLAAHVRAGDRIVVEHASSTAAPTPSPRKVFPRYGRRRRHGRTRTTSTRCARRCRARRCSTSETIANPTVSVADLEALGALVPRGGRARVGRQHVRLALPLHARRVSGFDYVMPLGDQVHRRSPRPDRRRGLHERARAARGCAMSRSTPAARWRRSKRGSACAD